MNLVVVESPAKAKTIKKYLGPDFEVLASYGHVRDLIPKDGAVDTEQGFCMHYQVIERNDRHVQAISRRLKDASTLYLATDPDREGEAISWHLYELLHQRGALRDKVVHRVVFHEITPKAVRAAVAQPRALSQDLINAQQARRALDYLVGFNLSPLLWKKIRRGLSAGRVQSPALRLIVEREQAIEVFQRREYWTIEADAVKETLPFSARLTVFAGEKIEQFSIVDATRALAVHRALLQTAAGYLVVEQVESKQRKRQPAPPFTTSTLQQEAARKLGFTTQRTMKIAQQLYEGVDLGGEAVGLITYMRTDSVNLAEEAVEEIRVLIAARYGETHLPKTPRHYKTKAKNAQEAHEAIRPTAALRAPAETAVYLSPEQARLYELIWKRTVACQMWHATLDMVAVDLACGTEHRLRANGTTIKDPGFMQVYLEGQDDVAADAEGEVRLPPLEVGDQVELQAIQPQQHFTEPPPRYGEASLVHALEEFGIGRPSTYASIISTLQDREYVRLEKKRFYPSDVGRVVNQFLTAHFPQYVDYDFTARLEDELDAVSRGEENWVPLLEQFWKPFKAKVDYAQAHVKRSDVTHEALDESCPKCGETLSIRLGRNGRFIGCTQYPKCDYTRDLVDASAAPVPELEGRNCPKCAAALVLKRGRYGKFVGCSTYPDCTYIEPLEKPETTGVTCPVCKQGQMMKRKSRRGKIFYSCSGYPDCDYALWHPPLAEACPSCGWPVLILRTARGKPPEKACPQPNCEFSVAVPPDS